MRHINEGIAIGGINQQLPPLRGGDGVSTKFIYPSGQDAWNTETVVLGVNDRNRTCFCHICLWRHAARLSSGVLPITLTLTFRHLSQEVTRGYSIVASGWLFGLPLAPPYPILVFEILSRSPKNKSYGYRQTKYKLVSDTAVSSLLLAIRRGFEPLTSALV